MPSLPTRPLGKNGPQVTALGFGVMQLSLYNGTIASDDDRFKVLDRAYELGETFWDSADIYADSEELLGKWFQRTGKRDEIFLATKFGNYVDAQGERSVRGDPDYVAQACAKSLRRLGVEQIDLYYCHRLDQTVPIEETVGAMAKLKHEGKVRYLGLSECSSESLRRAYAVHPIAAVQIEYSPFALDIEDPKIALLQTCRELGVAVVAYSPLGRGMITGRYKSLDDLEEGDPRRMFPRFSPENFPKNLHLVEELQSIAVRKQCTTGQLTLAWLMAQGEDVIPIPGTKRITGLEENVAALNVTLSPSEVVEIRKVVEAAVVHGDRYPTRFMLSTFADTPLLAR
ncbi:MAG: Aldo-keto reductase str7 [Thelocarpon superellum]|nr:MAG: Aldo-keto reductase str7 [Thelocarpon superellum]